MTCFLAIFLNWSLSSLHSFAASTFAGLNNYNIMDFISWTKLQKFGFKLNSTAMCILYLFMFGSAIMLITESKIFSTLWTGDLKGYKVIYFLLRNIFRYEYYKHILDTFHENLSYHRSELVSYPNGSAPGGCKIEMQTRPSG